MKKANTATMDPLIEGYFSYLDKVGRKTPRTIVDVRCTLRRAIARLGQVRPASSCGTSSWKIICIGWRPSGSAVAPKAAWRNISATCGAA